VTQAGRTVDSSVGEIHNPFSNMKAKSSQHFASSDAGDV